MILNPFYEKRYTRAEVDQVFSVTSYIFEQFFQQFFIKKKMTQTGAVANPLRKSRIVVLDGGFRGRRTRSGTAPSQYRWTAPRESGPHS